MTHRMWPCLKDIGSITAFLLNTAPKLNLSENVDVLMMKMMMMFMMMMLMLYVFQVVLNACPMYAWVDAKRREIGQSDHSNRSVFVLSSVNLFCFPETCTWNE